MLSIQEMVQKTKEQRKAIEEVMDTLGAFHPEEESPDHQIASILAHPKASVRKELRESLRTIPLREFLTSGVAGADYLIPDKIYQVMFEAAYITDIVPLCSTIVDCPGSTLKVDIAVDDQYKPHYYGPGGAIPTETIETTQATITPKTFGINPQITNDLIEDSQFDIIEMHLRQGARAMGEFATQIWLQDLIDAPDGDGTQNAVTTATADKTYLADLAAAWAANAEDGFISDTIILAPEPLTDILSDATVSQYSDQFHTRAVTDPPNQWGQFMGMNIVLVVGMNKSYTGDGALYISNKWHSFVLNKANATLTVRKRWLKIENYSDPIRDLVGATITARQDQITVYKDASCEITES